MDEFRLDERGPFDAYAAPGEYAAVHTLLHPQFSIVVPAPDPIKIPLAYPLARRDQVWAEVVNTWIELRLKDGTYDRLYRHWILGQSATPRTPRWSVMDDILHWGR
jgi:ABC-type amino acid transport substrate-binding protein